MLNTYYTDKHTSDFLILQDANHHKFAFDNCLFDLDKKAFRPHWTHGLHHHHSGVWLRRLEYPSQAEWYINTMLESIASNVVDGEGNMSGISDLQYLSKIFSRVHSIGLIREENYIYLQERGQMENLLL